MDNVIDYFERNPDACMRIVLGKDWLRDTQRLSRIEQAILSIMVPVIADKGFDHGMPIAELRMLSLRLLEEAAPHIEANIVAITDSMMAMVLNRWIKCENGKAFIIPRAA